jgi:hypothetical protein
MNKNDFTELAYNDHRSALMALFDMQQKLQAEQDATQATVIELAAELHAPTDDAEPATK